MKNKFLRVFLITLTSIIALVLFVYVYSVINISNSDAFDFAKTKVKQNQVIKEKIGKVIEFGNFPYGGFRTENGEEKAQVNLKVIGEKGEINATLNLVKDPIESTWKVDTLFLRD